MSEVQNAAPVEAAKTNPTETPVVEAQTTTPEAKAAETAKVEEKKRLKQVSYKANGKDYSEDLPFEIDDNPEAVAYLTKQLSLAKGAQEALHESSNTKKQVKAFVEYLGKDTAKALTEMGINVKDLAAAVIEEEIKNSQMTPEQKELEELRTQKKAMEEERQRLKEQSESEARTKEEQLAYEKISNEIAAAISTTHLPKEPATVKRVAEYMRIANQHGVEVTAKDVMPFVEQDLKEELKSILEKLDDDAFEDYVGKERMTRQRKKNIAKSKSAPTTPATAKANTVEVKSEPKKEDKGESKKQLSKDFFGFKL